MVFGGFKTRLKIIKFGLCIYTLQPGFVLMLKQRQNMNYLDRAEAEFKEFKLRLKLETRLKHGWFNLKLYSMFQDLSQLAQLKPDLRRGSNSLNSFTVGNFLYECVN